MTMEVRPLGVTCDLKCSYCYQNVQREAGNGGAPGYNLAALKKTIEAHGDGFHLFGGEPLLMPEQDLDELWRWGFEKYGRNGLQTNGTRLGPEHVEMIRRYNVTVGISMDGPGELNDARWAGTLQRTRQATARSEAAIRLLCDAGLPPRLMSSSAGPTAKVRASHGFTAGSVSSTPWACLRRACTSSRSRHPTCGRICR